MQLSLVKAGITFVSLDAQLLNNAPLGNENGTLKALGSSLPPFPPPERITSAGTGKCN